jgi:hypothetical protein
MSRTELLTESRARFLHAFMDAVDQATRLATLAIFRKADSCFSQVTQRHMLDAHRVFKEKQAILRNQLLRQMDQLLNRSFQTAYSNFRPAFASTFNVDTLSLVDTSHFEGQLKVDGITTAFRNAASVQLHELNTRMALIFEQDTIKERENPFRPWLLTRAISAASESLGEPPQIAALISEQLAESMQESIPIIYKSVNAYLAENGIAAQLHRKIERSRDAGPAAGGGNFEQIDVPSLPDASPAWQATERFEGFGSFGAVPPIDRNSRLETGAFPSLEKPSINHPAALPKPIFSEPFLSADHLPPERPTGNSQDNLARLIGIVQRKAAGVADKPKDLVVDFGDFNVFGNIDEADLVPAKFDSSENTFFSQLHRMLAADKTVADKTMAEKIGTDDTSSVDNGDLPVPPVSLALTKLLRTLMRQQSAGNAADREDLTGNFVLKERLALETAAGVVEEKLKIDIIAMVFEFMLADHRTPSGVRAEIGRIQLPILKIALEDATFFKNRSHPARQLVNRVGTITFGLSDTDQVLVRIVAELRKIVSTLYTSDDNPAHQFATLLEEFDRFVESELHLGQPDRTPENSTAFSSGALGHPTGQSAAPIDTTTAMPPIRVALEAMLNEILTEMMPDALMAEFLTTVWMDVITQSEITNDPNALRFRSAVPDLLWSISPRNDIDSRAKLVAKLPILVRTIRDGLSQLGWSAERQQPLLDWLVELHRNALRGNAGGTSNMSLAQVQARFAYFLKFKIQRKSLIERAADADAATAVASAASNVSFPVTNANVFTAGYEPVPTLTEGAALEGERIDKIVVDQLRSGAAVEFELNGAWGTARTDWSDQASSTLTLRIDGHDAPSSISMRTFKRTLKSGRLVYLQTVPLFERAIDSVRKSIEIIQEDR